MKTIFFLILGISAVLAQPIPVEKQGNNATDSTSHPVGSPSEHHASKYLTKLIVTDIAPAPATYSRKHELPSYEPAVYGSGPYAASSCHGHAHGYYGNPAHDCKIFHVCQDDGRLETFDCPPYTKFNNYLLVCDWPHKVDYNCDPLYKDQDYPVQTYNNAYPVDKSYLPSFMSLYPVPKPAEYIPEKSIYPIHHPLYKSYAKTYAPKPNNVYAPHKSRAQVYNLYPAENSYPAYPADKSVYPVYPVEKPSYRVHPEKHSHKSYAESKPAYPSEHKPSHKVYPVEKPAHQVYPMEKPSYNSYPVARPSAYPVEKVSYEVEKPVYAADKVQYNSYPVVLKAAAYPVQKASYNGYSVEKPAYNVEKPVYPVDKYPVEKSYSAYPVEHPSYNAHAYNPYSVEKPSHNVYPVEKPVYPVEKPSYSAYPVEKDVYPVDNVYPSAPSYNSYPVEKPAYNKPEHEKYAKEYPVEKQEYNSYGPEKPYGLPLYPENAYLAEYPMYNSYAEKAYSPVPPPHHYKSQEKIGYALKSYGEVSRYEAPQPYPGYAAEYRTVKSL